MGRFVYLHVRFVRAWARRGAVRPSEQFAFTELPCYFRYFQLRLCEIPIIDSGTLNNGI